MFEAEFLLHLTFSATLWRTSKNLDVLEPFCAFVVHIQCCVIAHSTSPLPKVFVRDMNRAHVSAGYVGTA